MAIVLLTDNGDEIRFEPYELVFVFINDTNAVPTASRELPGKEPFRWSTGTLPDRFRGRLFYKEERIVRCWEEAPALSVATSGLPVEED